MRCFGRSSPKSRRCCVITFVTALRVNRPASARVVFVSEHFRAPNSPQERRDRLQSPVIRSGVAQFLLMSAGPPHMTLRLSLISREESLSLRRYSRGECELNGCQIVTDEKRKNGSGILRQAAFCSPPRRAAPAPLLVAPRMKVKVRRTARKRAPVTPPLDDAPDCAAPN